MRHSLPFILWVILALQVLLPTSALSAQEETILADSTEYFPDTIGSRWHYVGRIITGPLQDIARTGFQNISTVTGTSEIKGVEVTVFHDTNPGNHGSLDSYYRRDEAGIVYYGSHPGTTLEKQLVPYQIVIFPLTVPSSFEQFNRRQLEFGTDLDGDHVNEQADLQAMVSVKGLETVSVPAGMYENALRIDARMTMNIHLSTTGQVVTGRDTMTTWFAPGVGLVKYVERQAFPGWKARRGRVTEITEELERVDIADPNSLSRRGKSPSKSIFTDHSGHHELREVIFPAGFRADP